MGFSRRRFALIGVAVLWLLLPPLYLWRVTPQYNENSEPIQVLTQYLTAVYARDFSRAYQYISSQDRGLKEEDIYVRERGAFSGFPLEVSRKLAETMQIRPVQQYQTGDGRMHIKVGYSLPDANAVAPLVLDWDEERLGLASEIEQRKILDSLENMARNGGLKMIQGEEVFVLVKDGLGWKMFLDWASGVRIRFTATAPPGRAIEARPTIPETIGHPGELFTVEYVVKNRSSHDLFARIVHRVEPEALAEYLDLVECGLMLPVRLPAGAEQSYASTYLIRSDLTEGTKKLAVTYEFQVEG